MDKPALRSFRGKGIGEIVEVLAVLDDDFHCAVEAGELTGAGVGNHDHIQVVDTVLHGPVVLQKERARAALERSGDALDGDVATGAFGWPTTSQHFTLTSGFEITVNLLVARETCNGIFIEFEGRVEGGDFYVEGAGSVTGHWSILLSGDGTYGQEQECGERNYGFHGSP